MKTRDYTSIKEELITTLRKDSDQQISLDDATKAATQCIDKFRELESADPSMFDKYITDHKGELINAITDKLSEPNAFEFYSKEGTINVIPDLLVTTITKSEDWQKYEEQCAYIQQNLTNKLTDAFVSQQFGRTNHRDLLVKTTVDKLMIEAKKNPELLTQLSDPKFTIDGITTQLGIQFLKSNESLYSQSTYDAKADYIVAHIKAQIPPAATKQAELAAQPSTTAQAEPTAQKVQASQEATTNKTTQAENLHPEKEGEAAYRRYRRREYRANPRPIHEIAQESPVMVAGSRHKEGSIVLKTILETQSDDSKALNADVNKAIADALGAGTLTLATPKPTGNATTYEVGGETLTQTKDSSGKLSFEPSDSFTGVLRVQRANPNGSLIPGAFDAFEYKDGNPISWSLSDKGVSRVSDIMKKSFEQAVTVVGLPSGSDVQVVATGQNFSPSSTPGGKPAAQDLGSKAAGSK